MTYSILAKDEKTGFMGIAVASRFFAVGAIVPFVGANCAVATQAFANPLYGVEGMARLSAGEPAEAVLADFLARDAAARLRQVHMMDEAGRIAAHTGEACTDWAGHLVGESFSVAGNMLAGAGVVEAAFDAYREHDEAPFAERLLAALEAAEAAGGDKRGRQSAALKIHRWQDYPWLNLRVDDLAEPLPELRRLLAVAGERYLQFADAMATAENFSGETDRAALDERIRRAEEQRAAQGIPSASRATSAD